jgi:hypothetical protein
MQKYAKKCIKKLKDKYPLETYIAFPDLNLNRS